MQTDINSQTGSYLALAGLIVLGLAKFGYVVQDTTIVTIISGLVALYGVVHQLVITKKIKNLALGAGIKGIK